MNHDIERTTGPCMRCGSITSFDDEYCARCNKIFAAEDDTVDARYAKVDEFLANISCWRTNGEEEYYCPSCIQTDIINLPITLEMLEKTISSISDPYAETHLLVVCDKCNKFIETEDILPKLIEED